MGKRIVSFDIFDTLLTRMVAVPRDLFLLAGEELQGRSLHKMDAAKFARLRATAETKARLALDHREANFDEIYAHLRDAFGWDDSQTRAAQQIELDTERLWTRPAPGAVERVYRARAESDHLLFISDMYLPTAFIQSLLQEHGFWRAGDQLFVSGETRCSKSSGGLFTHLRDKLGEIKSWRHFGDNPHSDVLMPRRHGIAAEHLADCALRRYESVFRPVEEDFVPLWRSKVAAAMRLARLNNPGDTEQARGLWDIAVSVSGPFFFGFVKWVLEEAQQRGIQRLYFTARDGQILFRIAQRIIADWKLPIEARYLYGSRQAWRPAASAILDDWFKEWVLAYETPTDVFASFSRMHLEPAAFKEDLTRLGFLETTWRDLLNDEARERLWEAIKSTNIGAAAIEQRRLQRDLCGDYLRQEGFADDVSIGIVDLGWRGSMQVCLEEIAKDFPARRGRVIHGFYIGLLNSRPEIAGRSSIYWREKSGVRTLRRTNYSFFERFAAANHGSTRGYRKEKGRYAPDLETTKTAPLLEFGIELFQDGMVKVSDIILEVCQPGEIPSEDFFHLSRRNFDLFVESPSLEEAEVFGKMPLHDQENETGIPTMIPPLTEWDILRGLLDRRRMPGWWLEGTLKLKWSPSLFFYLLADRYRALREAG